jgi:hypothetical protein
MGVIMGGRLSGPKLRLLLMATLGDKGNLTHVSEIVEQFGSN